MNSPGETNAGTEIRATAARWIVRRDRGLSAAESIEFELWLAADPRHAAALQRAAGSWALLDRVPEFTAQRHVADAAAAHRRSVGRQRLVFGSLAAAAAIAFTVVWSRDRDAPVAPPAGVSLAAGPRLLSLPDGTIVHLNRDSDIAERFTPGERRVRLVRGEAHFLVTKNPARPFVVEAGSVDVRAVGTAFDVQLQSSAVEVLVTEGVVKLNATSGAARVPDGAQTIPLVNLGHRAVIALKPMSPDAAVVVTAVSADEITRTLAWQEPLLRLGGATLAEIAAEFERRSGQRVVLADPALAQLRMGGRFRADNLDGFANLLATTFDVDVERAADGTLVLRKKNPVSR